MRRICCVLFVLVMMVDAKADDFYQEVIYPLALNVYHEARGESQLGQFMVAYVTVERTRANRTTWGGKTVRGVVYKGCQFSWTCDPKAKPPIPGKDWEKAVSAATLVATGMFNPPSVLTGALYYMNPKAAEKKNRCWFATHLRQVGAVGNHRFYTEEKPQYIPPSFGCI